MATSGEIAQSPGQCRTSGECESEEERASPTEVVEILEVKDVYSYTIPSFSAITVKLRHVIISNYDEADIATVLSNYPSRIDVFFCEDKRLTTVITPVKVKVIRGCCVPPQEFSCEIDIRKMNLLTSGDVFVAWRWEWSCEDDIDERDDSETEECSIKASDGDSDDNTSGDCDILFDNTQVTHTVTFKCIGVTREMVYQDTLAQASRQLKEGVKVPVRLFHEKNNPYDSRALAFQCNLGDDHWKRIGYVVKEALEETHEAIRNGNILGVHFGWVKFITDWRMSGPGYFTGINISRRGDWSSNIIKCSSHRNV